MQWSSELIASLVAALAKARAELVNPEKSLVASVTLMLLAPIQRAGPDNRPGMSPI